MAIRRAWARAQLLDGRRRTSADVAAHLVGLQGQDLAAVPWSLRARGTPGDVDGLVLTWSLRGTRHLHHPDDVGWIIDLVGPAFTRPSKRSDALGVTPEAVAKLCEALPLTRPEAKDVLRPREGQAVIHVIARAALQRRLVIVPAQPERYVPFPDGGHRPDDPLAELARRYLVANGPATPADFAAWSGLPARDAFAAIAGELVEEGGRWRLATHPPSTRHPSPLRLLGAFDSLLLGHADRSPIVPPEHARRVNAGGGMIKPVVVSDGEIIATWSPSTRTVDLFRPLNPDDSAALKAHLALKEPNR